MSLGEPVQLGEGIAARMAPGPGEKVLWIHGYTLDSSTWAHLWSRLPEWHHIGIDLPGHGASAPLAGHHTLSSLGQTIGRLALDKGVRHVVGLSFGGMIALQVGIEYPTEFATLILGAAGVGGGPQDPHTRTRYMEMIKLFWQRGRGPWLTELWMSWPPDLFKGAAQKPELWAELKSLVDRHTWQEMRNVAMQNLANYKQTAEALSHIQAAGLVLVGEEEMPAFKECADFIRNAIPNCDYAYLPNTGHLCMLESVSLVEPIIGQHLRQHALTA